MNKTQACNISGTHKKGNSVKPGNKIFTLLLSIVICGVLYLIAPILTPFLVGILLAYLANPLVNLLMKCRLPRLLAVIIVFLVMFGILTVGILLLIPLVQDQIDILTDTLPNIITWLQNSLIPWIMDHLGLSGIVNAATLKSVITSNLSKASGMADGVLKALLHSGFQLVEFMVTLILIPVVTFYLLCDWDYVLKGIRNLVPRHVEPTFVKLVKECDSVLSAFFRGQLLVMLALGIIYSVGLVLTGLQLGVTIGIISGILSIVPYLGFISGIVAASIAASVQFGTFSAVLFVWLVFAVGHLIEHTFLTPKLVGDRIGLHPVAVIFAILAGGCLFGFMGVLLALPVASVIMVWVRFLHKRYRRSKLYQQT
jgi:predicted PurR-regulated permease PerM